jgi:hypothetical protein
MKKELEFPRTYTTSSAAYRVVRQLKEKGDTREFTMTKLTDKVFELSIKKEVLSMDEFFEKLSIIEKENISYKYFSEGIHGEGYYELKKGNRRRPNSLFVSLHETQSI